MVFDDVTSRNLCGISRNSHAYANRLHSRIGEKAFRLTRVLWNLLIFVCSEHVCSTSIFWVDKPTAITMLNFMSYEIHFRCCSISERSIDWKNAEAKWNHEKKERHQNYHTHINIQDKHALADFFVGVIRFNDYDECKRSAWYDHIIRLTYERRAHVSDSNFELKLTRIELKLTLPKYPKNVQQTSHIEYADTCIRNSFE